MGCGARVCSCVVAISGIAYSIKAGLRSRYEIRSESNAGCRLDADGQQPLNQPMSEAASESRTNATEYTVSEISGALKRTVEDVFGNVRVRGEISGYRGPHSSGHA